MEKTGKTHTAAFNALDQVDQLFLFDGFIEHFGNKIPRQHGSVIAHNDGQENNVLLMMNDNEKMLLIDYEYCGWNPPAYDIANYMNEMIIDNNYPSGKGVKFYYCNFPETAEERSFIIKQYMLEMYNYLCKE